MSQSINQRGLALHHAFRRIALERQEEKGSHRHLPLLQSEVENGGGLIHDIQVT